ncbi:MAG: aminopeptidase [Vallitalea sp.]|jgi:hypothetical protein|nr:aminopeptidase [Vallitalea sp.]
MKEYYKKENEVIADEYAKSLISIEDIVKRTQGDDKYEKYFNKLGEFILMLSDHERELDENYFKNKTFEELKRINKSLYQDILPENYNMCYGNPTYAVNQFGKEMGQILSFLYAKVFENIQFAYQHKVFLMNRVNQLFIKIYEHIMNNNRLSHSEIKTIILEDARKYVGKEVELHYDELCNSNRTYLSDMIRCDDLSNYKYLFKYGYYISENEIKIAQYLNSVPKDKIKLMANIMSEGYRIGFIRDNKDISIKSAVSLRYRIGFELVIKEVISNFEKINLKPIINIETKTDTEYGFSFTRLDSTKPNKQYYYDHRYDYALYFDEDYVQVKQQAIKEHVCSMGDSLHAQGGPAVLEIFGEKPFYPENKSECLKLNNDQTSLDKISKTGERKEFTKYLSGDNYSFTIVSYPIPEIGEQFEEIFDETIKVNTLDVEVYERIQEKIIDALDKGDYVHVVGKGTDTKTDIMVKLHEIKNAEKETLFHNCLADVNIPVGEVYTSPTLKGTNGTLFVKEVYLKGLKYNNLKITFKDGYIDSYSCTNFDSEKENEKYIYENLIFPNDTLPIGEFAIGTNTTAYVMANKYNISDVLPILITEKTGPHFAIGDTCFAWGEDLCVYNSNGKEVIARDNEKSILRKTNIDEAYTGKHTDITLPYSELESIDIITKDKKRIRLIKDGRFILEGTEKLNKALDEA